MSESFEQIDSVRVFFKDGSCAFLKNHGLNVNAVITQLTEERAALAAENANLKALQWETLKERNKAEAENERLRKAGDAMYNCAVQDSTGLWLLNPFQDWHKMNHPRTEGGAK